MAIDFLGTIHDHETDQAVLGCLVAVALFECYFGCRFFKQTLAISGFCFSFVATTSIVSQHTDDDRIVYGSGAGAGILFACLSVASVWFGLLLLGCAAGLATSYVAYLVFIHYIDTAHDTPIFYIVLSVAGVLGAVIAQRLSRWIVAVTTSIGGAMVATRCVDMLWDNVLTKDAVESHHLPKEGWYLLIAFGFLSLTGFFYQIAGGYNLDGTRRSKEDASLLATLPRYNDYSTNSKAPAQTTTQWT